MKYGFVLVPLLAVLTSSTYPTTAAAVPRLPPPPPPPPVSPATCRVVLTGSFSHGSAHIAVANVTCNSSAGVTVKVGQQLLAFTSSWMGVDVSAQPHDEDEGWGITFSDVPYMRLQDSVVRGLPLGARPLLQCSNCNQLEMFNVTVSDVWGPDSRATDITSNKNLQGPLLATNVTSAELRDLNCSDVRHSRGWACIWLEYDMTTSNLSQRRLLNMTNCTLERNSVDYTGIYGRSNPSAKDINLQGVIAVTAMETGPAAPPGNASLEVNMADVQAHNNSGGFGTVFISVGLNLDAVYVSGCSFTNNVAKLNGSVFSISGSVEAFVTRGGTKFSGNQANDGDGGAIVFGSNVGVLNVTGGSSFLNNSAISGSGGGVSCRWGIRAFELSGASLMHGNWASGDGGAIMLQTSSNLATLTISGNSSMSFNTASDGNGGAMSVAGVPRSITLDDRSSINSNTAGSNGGGLHLASGTLRLMLMGGSCMANNSAVAGGGAIAAANSRIGTLLLDGGSSISGCTTRDGHGGAVLIGRGLTELVVMGGSSLDANTAPAGRGGAVWVLGDVGNFTFSGGGRLHGNTAADGGGGVAVAGNVTGGITLSASGSVTNNIATRGSGGAGWIGGQVGTLRLNEGASIGGNMASDSGGGFWIGGSIGTVVLSNGSSMYGNIAETGSGGALAVHGSISSSLQVRANSSMYGNDAALDGGAVWVGGIAESVIAGNGTARPRQAVAVMVVGGSWLVNNTAQQGYGGALCLRDGGSLLDIRTGSSGNNIEPDQLIFSLEVSDNSRLDGNWAGERGGAVLMASLATVTLEGNSSMSFNTAQRDHGGALYVFSHLQESNLTLDNGSVMNFNTAGGQGGAVHFHGGITRMQLLYGSSMANNRAVKGGGAIAAPYGGIGVLLLDGGSSIRGCTAVSGDGGAILVAGSLSELAVLDGSSLDSNAAIAGRGGAAAVGNALGQLSIDTNSWVCGNTAGVGSGGGIWVLGDVGSATVSNGGRLCNNTAADSGGGLAVGGNVAGMFIVRDAGSIADNTAAGGSGGAAWVTGHIKGLQLQSGGSIHGNSASISGGGLWVGGLIHTITTRNSTALYSNTAVSGSGGALAVLGGVGLMELGPDSTMYDNAAGQDGGAVWMGTSLSNLSIVIASSTILRNRAGQSGGAVYLRPLGEASQQQPAGSQVAVWSINITGSELSMNLAGWAGGALMASAANYSTLYVSITNSTLFGNSAGSDSTASGNDSTGGAVSLIGLVAANDDWMSALVSNVTTANGMVSDDDIRRIGGCDDIPLGYCYPWQRTSTAGTCTVVFVGTSFEQSTSKGDGGAVFVAVCTTVVDNSVFVNNSAAQSGGAIAAVTSNPTPTASTGLLSNWLPMALLIFNSSFSENSAWTTDGGAVYTSIGVSITSLRSNFTGNTAGRNGGAWAMLIPYSNSAETGAATTWSIAEMGWEYSDKPYMLMGCQFDSNSATLGGGALFWSAPGKLHVIACSFCHNLAGEAGGAVAAYPPYDFLGTQPAKVSLQIAHPMSVYVLDSSFAENEAGSTGGAIHATVSSAGFYTALVANCVLRANNAGGMGGGLAFTCPLSCGNVANTSTQGLLPGDATNTTSQPSAPLLRLFNCSLLSNSVSGRSTTQVEGGGAAAFMGSFRVLAQFLRVINNSAIIPQTAGGGGGIFVGCGSSFALLASDLQNNSVYSPVDMGAGGSLYATSCTSLAVLGSSITDSTSVNGYGGGVHADGCRLVYFQDVRISRNLATAGGGVFIAGPTTATASANDGNVPAGTVVVLYRSILLDNVASDGNSSRRFHGYGGGLLLAGRVAVLLSNCDLSSGNAARYGSSVMSTQQCMRMSVMEATGNSNGSFLNGEVASTSLAQDLDLSWVQFDRGGHNDTDPINGMEVWRPVWSTLSTVHSLNTQHGCWPLILIDTFVPFPSDALQAGSHPSQIWLLDSSTLWVSCNRSHVAADSSDLPPAMLGPFPNNYTTYPPTSVGSIRLDDVNMILWVMQSKLAGSGSPLPSTQTSRQGLPPLPGGLTAEVTVPQLLQEMAACVKPPASGPPLQQGTSTAVAAPDAVALGYQLYISAYLSLPPVSFQLRAIHTYSDDNSVAAGAQQVMASGAYGAGLQWALPTGVNLQLEVQLLNDLGLKIVGADEWMLASVRINLVMDNNNTSAMAVPATEGLDNEFSNLQARSPEVPAANDSTAVWDHVVVSGWPGSYELVVTAVDSGATLAGTGLTTKLAPLHQPVVLLPCRLGQRLDTSRVGATSGALTSCTPCLADQFNLWIDTRLQQPLLSSIRVGIGAGGRNADELVDTDGNSSAAALADMYQWVLDHEVESQCRNCPNDAFCPGGPVLVPDPGFWHSSPNSSGMHRCPRLNACMWGHQKGTGDTTAERYQSPQQLPINSTFTAMGDANVGAQGGDGTATVDSSTPADTRTQHLLVCQQLWYNSLLPETSHEAGNVIMENSTTIMPKACRLWGLPPDDPTSYMQLQCATGYTGNLCATCQPGYFLTADLSCTHCLSVPTTAALLSIGMLSNAALVLYTAWTNVKEGPSKVSGATAADVLKVAIIHMQYFIIIGRLNMDWPNVITRFQDSLGALTGAQSKFMSSPSCLRPAVTAAGQAAIQVATALTTPAVVVAFAIIVWIIRYHLAGYMLKSVEVVSPGGLAGISEKPRASATNSACLAARWNGVGATSKDGNSDVADGWLDTERTAQVRAASKAFEVSVNNGILRGMQALEMDCRGHDNLDPPSKASAASRCPRALSCIPKTLGPLKARLANGTARFMSALADRVFMEGVDMVLSLPQQLLTVVMVALFVLYAGWSQVALSIFACMSIDDGEGLYGNLQQATWKYGYWLRNMNQECYSGVHAAVYLPVGIAAVLLVCVAPPVTSFTILWRVRHKLDETATQHLYGFLYMRYRRQYFWWEGVVQLQTLCLVAIDVFGRLLPVQQQAMLLVVGFNMLAVVNMILAPVRFRLLQVLEFVSLGVMSTTVALGLFFMNGYLHTADTVAIGAGILCLNVGLLLFIVAVLLHQYHQRRVARSNDWMGRAGPVRNKGTQQAAAVPIVDLSLSPEGDDERQGCSSGGKVVQRGCEPPARMSRAILQPSQPPPVEQWSVSSGWHLAGAGTKEV